MQREITNITPNIFRNPWQVNLQMKLSKKTAGLPHLTGSIPTAKCHLLIRQEGEDVGKKLGLAGLIMLAHLQRGQHLLSCLGRVGASLLVLVELMKRALP